MLGIVKTLAAFTFLAAASLASSEGDDVTPLRALKMTMKKYRMYEGKGKVGTVY